MKALHSYIRYTYVAKQFTREYGLTDENEALVRLGGAFHTTKDLSEEINGGHVFQVGHG